MIEHVGEIKLDDFVSTMAADSEGSLVAAGFNNRVVLVELKSGKQVLEIHTAATATGLAISADRGWLAVATGSPTVRVYDCESGKMAFEFVRGTVPDFLRNQKQVQVEFLPQSKMLLTRADNSDVTIWNCESGAWDHLYRMPHRNGFVSVAPDGKHIAVLSEPNPNAYTRQVTLYRLHDGFRLRWNRGHEADQGVNSGAFSPDGIKLATCVIGDGIRIWNVADGEQSAWIGESKKAPFERIAFAGDAQHLICLVPGSLELRHVERTIEPIARSKLPEGGVRGFAAFDHGRSIVTCTSEAGLDVWRVDRPA